MHPSPSVRGVPLLVRGREHGDIENGSAACGQPAGLIHGVRPVRELIEAGVAAAEAVLSRLLH